MNPIVISERYAASDMWKARCLRAPVVALIFAVIACGCGFFDGLDGINMSWQEEVRLPGGALIVVKRTASGERRGEIGGPDRWEPKAMTLRIPAASAGEAVPPEWRSQYIPMLLDYDPSNATWSVVATFAYCQAWEALGRPTSPYLAFQSRAGGDWQRVELEASRLGQEANLLVSVRATGESALVREQEKQVRSRRAAERYRKIVERWTTNC